MKLRPRLKGQNSATVRTTAATGFPWCGLPFDVQIIILKQLADDRDGGEAQGGPYAAVCLHWQAFFEKLNFSKLTLHDSDLSVFEKIVKRRTKNGKTGGVAASGVSPMPRIQHIWLRVGLLEYECWDCRKPPDGREAIRNNVLFTRSLWKLLDILSTWEKRDENHGQQLTLELSAHSPSDSQHLLKGDAEHEDDYPYRAGIDTQRKYIEDHTPVIRPPLSLQKSLRMSNHFHDHNLLFMPYSLGMDNLNEDSAKRLISPLKFDFFRVPKRAGQPRWRLPEVKMVSSFLMRRQYHRAPDGVALKTLVGESLTGLRSMRLERWRTPDLESQAVTDWRLGLAMTPVSEGGTILGSTVPSSLETLSLFEDFNNKMNGIVDERRPRPSRTKVLQWVANAAVNVKNVSVSFLSDAKDCLLLGTTTMPNLESLALTSQHWLEPSQEHTENLLKLAASAAQNMPKLQIMEIWTCGKGRAAIFRYEATGTAESSACRITWRCSWDNPKKSIDWDGVVGAWRHVAATNAQRQLKFSKETLPDGRWRYGKYGAILHQLKLRNLILDPTSVMQVRMGTGAEDEPEVEAWRPSVPDSYWSQRTST